MISYLSTDEPGGADVNVVVCEVLLAQSFGEPVAVLVAEVAQPCFAHVQRRDRPARHFIQVFDRLVHERAEIMHAHKQLCRLLTSVQVKIIATINK